MFTTVHNDDAEFYGLIIKKSVASTLAFTEIFQAPYKG